MVRGNQFTAELARRAKAKYPAAAGTDYISIDI
jgi:hypothetical protein